ncbi:hypothetical protein K503DRAFT_111915 [Rhizopogon vinicolor AM-OR11-026]|uniref:Uncharacterized protein n=1 Tax=Rhizopogon vinicolor AM-OR11-026 TaxID=1314800 RepID=A0A1B7MF14_9AGAM|nr:hypothetical protein K503DRAFT_111915 [Rhizopogon vinicolor AM-OR11-026]
MPTSASHTRAHEYLMSKGKWQGGGVGEEGVREDALDRPWRDAQRDRLIEMAQRPKESIEVLVSDTDGEGGEDRVRVRVGKVKKMKLNYAMLDIALVGSPNRSEPVTCKELEELFD